MNILLASQVIFLFLCRKTNILDAIHYLALTKSHFVPQDRMAIMQGSDFFRLEGHFVNASNNTKVVIKYRPAEKRLEVNDDPLTRLADHIGTIGMVMIAPDDLDVIVHGCIFIST